MITPKLEKLARAMAEHEGWFPTAQLPFCPNGPSPAYKNHNPGNLRSSIFALGVRDGFAYFHSDFVGFYAMLFDLMWKCEGRTKLGLYPSSTLYELIKIYCGENEEVTEAYVAHVEQLTGFKRTDKLSSFVT